jgi:superfamily II DNA/RNA helicase
MSFTEFSFHPQLQANLDTCGYLAPTPIQQQAIGPVLDGRDLLGLAQTGTGKTAAFVLPILQRLLSGPRGCLRALIVSPTRELAEQTHEYITKLAARTKLRSAVVYGGVGKPAQIAKIRGGAEIIVACPGRLLDLAQDGVVNFSKVQTLVLDEADHMFDKGFLPDIRRIVKLLPKHRQNLVFSATMPAEIRSLVEGLLTNPATVQVDHDKTIDTISHVFLRVAQHNKIVLLRDILQQDGVSTAIVFTRTKHKAKSLAQQLAKNGHKATSLQGNLSQQKRQEALNGFKNGTYTILVATDIAARGIDVSDISHIINFDMPETTETYTHRTGRTGRAKRHGEALSFIAEDNGRLASMLERMLGNKLVYRPHSYIGQAARSENQPQEARQQDHKFDRNKRPPRGKRSSQRNRSLAFDFGV